MAPIVEASLTAHDIVYRQFDCDPAYADTAAFCEHYGFKPETGANTLIVAGKTNPVTYAACVVLATTKLDVNKTVCGLLKVKKASFANTEQATSLTGMMVGGVTVFGLPADLPLYIDDRLMDVPEIIMGGGNRSSKVLLNPNELLKLPGAQVVNGLAQLREQS